ncbi:SpoIVB peptidase [Hydrogenoanaerobacterium sp.]|uniref:SpoIVB peptidase n=1 Tax=Hydrogenoanaerobacterium sp. TaxID=2953763 RepID=UPI0028981D2E|nr:SpoIVB peptidase [Hydrogenoanaerobacterium sp.]
MRKFLKVTVGTFAICVAALLCVLFYISSLLPDRYMIAEGEQFSIRSQLNVTASVENNGNLRQVFTQSGNTYQAQLKLFGAIPLKQVTVQVVDKQMVAACGSPFGIKMFTEGVMVVGLSDLDTEAGSINPAKEAGIRIGDVMTRIDGKEVYSNEQVGEIVEKSGGKPLKVSLKRKNTPMTLTLVPCKSNVSDGYKAGMWVRDSSAGIGTMTFYDPISGVFGGLGHAVCDVDTGEILPLMSGEAVQVDITGCVKGTSGAPGELQGNFYENGKLGNLYLNNETGIYGTLNAKITPPVLMPIAFRQEVKASAATILTTLNGSTPQEYDIIIEKVNFGDNNPTKNMVIRITDPKLLAKTGGIIQGMSGSPILQDGKLVGAVTHVFVNDPTRGFGIFAENMYYSIDNVENAIRMAS